MGIGNRTGNRSLETRRTLGDGRGGMRVKRVNFKLNRFIHPDAKSSMEKLKNEIIERYKITKEKAETEVRAEMFEMADNTSTIEEDDHGCEASSH